MSVNNLLPSTLVIGFGHKSGHGKDSCAKAISNQYRDYYNIERYAFADALKLEVFSALTNPLDPYWGFATECNYLSLPHPRSVYLSEEGRMEWINDQKTVLGPVLQSYGTEYRRAKHPFYWINALRARVSRDEPTVALITDLRFPNEAQFIHACRGYTVKCVRDGFVNPTRPSDHPSETMLDGHTYDYEIHASTYGIAQLEQDACDLFEMILQREQPSVPSI